MRGLRPISLLTGPETFELIWKEPMDAPSDGAACATPMLGEGPRGKRRAIHDRSAVRSRRDRTRFCASYRITGQRRPVLAHSGGSCGFQHFSDCIKSGAKSLRARRGGKRGARGGGGAPSPSVPREWPNRLRPPPTGAAPEPGGRAIQPDRPALFMEPLDNGPSRQHGPMPTAAAQLDIVTVPGEIIDGSEKLAAHPPARTK